VHPFEERPLEQLAGSTYDLVVATAGFEPRAIAIPEALGEVSGRRVAVEFPDRHIESYDANRQWYDNHGYELKKDWGAEFLPAVKEWLSDLATADWDQPPCVAIDVSSMTRSRIASVVQAVFELPSRQAIRVDFLYAPATFTEPKQPPPAFLNLDVVSPFFAGGIDAGMETALLVGLGYEPYKAAGTVENLEPSKVVLLVPHGSDPRYLNAVLKENDGLLSGPLGPERIDYQVADPFDTFATLESLAYDLLAAGYVPAMVPFGPKIFALCRCLAALMHVDSVPVWRVTYREDEPPYAAIADGHAYGLTLEAKPLGRQARDETTHPAGDVGLEDPSGDT
jgi:hypothetical protein